MPVRRKRARVFRIVAWGLPILVLGLLGLQSLQSLQRLTAELSSRYTLHPPEVSRGEPHLAAASMSQSGESINIPQIRSRFSFEEDIDTPTLRRPGGPREFYFTRAAYTGYGFRNFRSWSVDFPKADRQFLIGLRRLTILDAYELENPIRLTDPNLGRYPFIYAVEVGYMALTDPEVLGLRRYLTAGGFLVIDDFWGSVEWENFEMEIERILPGHDIVGMPLDHPIFTCFYNVKEIVQVPNVGQGMSGGPTWEKDGYTPMVRGVFDDKGRLMVVINWNTDLGDAWEWAENPYYPLKFSTYAYQMGVNFIIYGMSH